MIHVLFNHRFSFQSVLSITHQGQYVVRYASQTDGFRSTLRRLTLAILASGVMICVLHHILNLFVEKVEKKNLSAGTQGDKGKGGKSKSKPTMMESIRFLRSSKYLGLVTILVLGYGIMYNFLEISWKVWKLLASHSAFLYAYL